MHRSSGDASGHGWWENINTSATHADVDIKLQAQVNGAWRDQTPWMTKRVRAGGGSANRTTARFDCNGSSRYRWHSIVDVDLVGIIDDSKKAVTPTVYLPCGPNT